MQVVSNAPNSELQQGAPPWSRLVHAPLIGNTLHKAVALRCLPGNERPLAWLVPPHIAHPRIVHVNTDSTGTRPHIHLPLDADAGTPPKPQQTLQTRDEKTRHHPHPLQTAVPASHSILYHGHLLGHRIIPEPLPLLLDTLYCKQTPATSFGFGSASFFLAFLDVRNHPRASSTSTNSSRPASRVEHAAVV